MSISIENPNTIVLYGFSAQDALDNAILEGMITDDTDLREVKRNINSGDLNLKVGRYSYWPRIKGVSDVKALNKGSLVADMHRDDFKGKEISHIGRW